MLKWSLVICGLLALSGGAGAGAPANEPDALYSDGILCGSLCQLPVDPQPGAALASPGQTHPHWRFRASRHSRHRRITSDEVPLPKTRPEDAPHSQPAQQKVVAPPANEPKESKAPALEAVVELASQLSKEAARDVISIVPRSDPETGLDEEVTSSVPRNDSRVALVIVKDRTLSIPELARKAVALDSDLSGSAAAIRTAMVAAGATEVQMSEDQAKAIGRLLEDEVPAAILGLVSRTAADSFPNVDGYRIFHVPLSPN
jgi:hypothetical protein